MYNPGYREINLNHLTGAKKLRILVAIYAPFLNSQSGIDDIRLISKEYSDEQFQVVLKSSGQPTSGQLIIAGVPDLSIDLVADINTVSFMPLGNIIKINYINDYSNTTENPV